MDIEDHLVGATSLTIMGRRLHRISQCGSNYGRGNYNSDNLKKLSQLATQ